MKKLLCVFGAAALLAACATTDPQVAKADQDAHQLCRNVDAPIGSHLVKRSDCGAASQATPEQKEQARRAAELLQQSQTTRITGAKKGG